MEPNPGHPRTVVYVRANDVLTQRCVIEVNDQGWVLCSAEVVDLMLTEAGFAIESADADSAAESVH